MGKSTQSSLTANTTFIALRSGFCHGLSKFEWNTQSFLGLLGTEISQVTYEAPHKGLTRSHQI